jgi:hypothetical protein
MGYSKDGDRKKNKKEGCGGGGTNGIRFLKVNDNKKALINKSELFCYADSGDVIKP